MTTTVTGEQFKQVLEEQWQHDEKGQVPSRPFLSLGLSNNVSYTYDENLPERQRITSVWVNGKPIGPKASYTVGSGSFLINGGDKDWGRFPPYRELGFEAVGRAGATFSTGSAGAGTGALTAGLKGGLGSASTVLPNGITIGALVAVNALGSATVGDTGHFWSAPFELDDEFGGLGLPHPMPADAADIRIKFRDRQAAVANTTIAVIATDAVLTKAEAKRLAIAAHDGFARGLWPAHTPLDGDLIFALATGASGKTPTLEDFIDLGAVAASTMARAIARGVHDATPAENDLMPCWSQRR